MKKTAFGILLCTLICLQVLVVNAAANDSGVYRSGVCGTSVYWALYNDGELVFSGEGDMQSSFSSNPPWSACKSKITAVTVGNDITSIGSYAFSGCTKLEKVVIGNNVTTIGGSAFERCTALTTVQFNERLSTLGTFSFYNCSSLSSVINLPNIVTIGGSAFENCTSLKTVNTGKSLTSIGAYAFSGCTLLESVEFPASVETIGYDSFLNCTNLRSFIFPKNVTNVEASILKGCSNLEYVVLPASVATIEKSAFYGCNSIKSVFSYVDKTTITIDTGNIPLDKALWFYISAPEDIVSIIDSTLDHGSIELLTPYVAKGSSFPVIARPSAGFEFVKLNVDYGFSDGNTITVLPEGDFSEVKIFADFVANENAASLVDYGQCGLYSYWAITNDGALEITGIGAMDDFQYQDAPWNDYLDQITSISVGSQITTIGDNAFLGCGKITSFSFPEAIAEVGDNAFNDCVNLETIIVPDTVTSMGRAVFGGCSRLSSATLLCNLNELPSSLFFHCTSLTSINIPDSVTLINDGCFSGCDGLTAIYLDGIQTIKFNAFINCANLEYIVISDDLNFVGDSAFEGCSSLVDVFNYGNDQPEISDENTELTNAIWHYIDESTTEIGVVDLEILVSSNGDVSCNYTRVAKGEVFSVDMIPVPGYVASALTLTNATANGNIVTVAGSGDFSKVTVKGTFEMIFPDRNLVEGASCGTDLTWCYYDDGTLYIYGSGSMSDYTSEYIPSVSTTATSAPWGAYCKEISTVVFGEGVTSIGNEAFYNCSNIQSVIFSKTLASIGSFAFASCDKLSSIIIPDTVTNIESYAFSYCDSLTVVSIGTGITQVNQGTFKNCPNLEVLFLGNNIQTINARAVEVCTKLSVVYYDGTNTAWNMIEVSDVGNDILASAEIIVSDSTWGRFGLYGEIVCFVDGTQLLVKGLPMTESNVVVSTYDIYGRMLSVEIVDIMEAVIKLTNEAESCSLFLVEQRYFVPQLGKLKLSFVSSQD